VEAQPPGSRLVSTCTGRSCTWPHTPVVMVVLVKITIKDVSQLQIFAIFPDLLPFFPKFWLIEVMLL